MPATRADEVEKFKRDAPLAIQEFRRGLEETRQVENRAGQHGNCRAK